MLKTIKIFLKIKIIKQELLKEKYFLQYKNLLYLYHDISVDEFNCFFAI